MPGAICALSGGGCAFSCAASAAARTRAAKVPTAAARAACTQGGLRVLGEPPSELSLGHTAPSQQQHLRFIHLEDRALDAHVADCPAGRRALRRGPVARAPVRGRRCRRHLSMTCSASWAHVSEAIGARRGHRYARCTQQLLRARAPGSARQQTCARSHGRLGTRACNERERASQRMRPAAASSGPSASSLTSSSAASGLGTCTMRDRLWAPLHGKMQPPRRHRMRERRAHRPSRWETQQARRHDAAASSIDDTHVPATGAIRMFVPHTGRRGQLVGGGTSIASKKWRCHGPRRRSGTLQAARDEHQRATDTLTRKAAINPQLRGRPLSVVTITCPLTLSFCRVAVSSLFQKPRSGNRPRFLKIRGVAFFSFCVRGRKPTPYYFANRPHGFLPPHEPTFHRARDLTATFLTVLTKLK